MHRRRLLLSLVLLVALAGVGVGVAWAFSTDRITRESFYAIGPGMTEQDVERLLGGPAGDYRTAPVVRCSWPILGSFGRSHLAYEPQPTATREWHGNEGLLTVVLDQHGNVMGKTFSANCRRTPDFFTRVRRWLGL